MRSGVLVALLDLAAEVHQERAVGAVDDLGALDGVDRAAIAPPCSSPAVVDGDVAQRVPVVERDQVDGADRAAGLADRGGDPAEHAGAVVDRARGGRASTAPRLKAWREDLTRAR